MAEPQLTLDNQGNIAQKVDFADYQKNPNVVILKRGAILVKTEELGYIQFGLPLGGIVELNELKIDLPNYYVVPSIQFHKKQALNLAEFQAPALINFIKNKPFYLICQKHSSETIKKVFTLTYRPVDPNELEKKIKFYDAMEPNPRPNFPKEFSYMLSLLQSQNEEVRFNDMITYHEFSSQGLYQFTNVAILKRGNGYIIYENGKILAAIPDQIDITYIEEVNWDQEIKQKYEMNQLQQKVSIL